MNSVPQPAPLRRSFIRFPTQVEYGSGMLGRIGEFTASYGKRAYCLFDPFFRGSEAAATVMDALHAVGIETYDSYEVHPNPRAGDIDKQAAECMEQKCDFVVAMGGGGTLDIGKAVAFLVTNGRSAWDYTVKENQFYHSITIPPLPFVAVPTTAGTGSEATIYSVVNNPDIQRKCTIRSFELYPRLAIVDPELMLNIPPLLTALTGIGHHQHIAGFCHHPVDLFDDPAEIRFAQIRNHNANGHSLPGLQRAGHFIGHEVCLIDDLHDTLGFFRVNTGSTVHHTRHCSR